MNNFLLLQDSDLQGLGFWMGLHYTRRSCSGSEVQVIRGSNIVISCCQHFTGSITSKYHAVQIPNHGVGKIMIHDVLKWKSQLFYLHQIFLFKSDFFFTYDFLKCAIDFLLYKLIRRTYHVQLRCKKCDWLLLTFFRTYYWHRITKQEIEELFRPAAVNIGCIISWCWKCIFVIWTHSCETA